jgi:hypothetical protein
MDARRRFTLLTVVVALAVGGLFLIEAALTAPWLQVQASAMKPALVSSSTAATTPLEKAYEHLTAVMDRCHLTFDVYTDVGSGCNHFMVRARFNNSSAIDDAYTGTVHSGATSISNTFYGTGSTWDGWSFQNGVLLSGSNQPLPNWGTYPNAGYDLSGATALTFWARGDKGGERVEFFTFAINTGAYHNSAPKRTTYVTLTNTWRLYTITLTGLDLHYIIDGFGWTAVGTQNGSQPITFYLDDIRFDKPHLNDLHFLRSYETLTGDLPFDNQFRNVAYVYDNALALIAYVKHGDWSRAKLLADAFVYAQQHDRFYMDGWLRNAYQDGDLALPPGWNPVGAARLSGYLDPSKQWREDPDQVGTSTGNVAWAMIALLNYYEARGGAEYLSATINLGNWIISNTYATQGAGGYTGGYVGDEAGAVKQLWKSSEHNLDIYVAFARLFQITGDPTWQDYAQHAKNFVDAMNPDGQYYRTGTTIDGVTLNESVIPLDTQSWSLLAQGVTTKTLAAIATAEISHTAVYSGFEGFDFNTDKDAPWPEGTGQMDVVYWVMGETTKAQHYLAELRDMQTLANNSNGKGIVASVSPTLTTGFGWEYYNRLHVGATAWFAFAEQKYNPYYSPLHANFTFATVGLPALTVAFSNTSAGGYSASTWSFGDGMTSALTNPVHTYSAARVYTVALTVSGLPGVDSATTVVNIKHYVFLPLIRK